MVAYTGLIPTTPLPPPEGINRREWIATNIASTQALLDPMLERMTEQLGPAKGAAQLWLGVASSAEIGVLIGYLAKRVLGQYEFVLLRENADGREPRLLFVLPNLGERGRAIRGRRDRVRHLGGAARGHARGAVQRRALAAGPSGEPGPRAAGQRRGAHGHAPAAATAQP